MNLNLEYIPRLTNNFIWRYEPHISEGTLFIYQIENKKILEGNEDLYKIINLTDGKKNIEHIIGGISKDYDNCYDQIKDSILKMYSWLKDENIIE